MVGGGGLALQPLPQTPGSAHSAPHSCASCCPQGGCVTPSPAQGPLSSRPTEEETGTEPNAGMGTPQPDPGPRNNLPPQGPHREHLTGTTPHVEP